MRAGPAFMYWPGEKPTVCVSSPIISIFEPGRRVQLRPPVRSRASSTVTE